jgi:chromosome segregation ATPase
MATKRNSTRKPKGFSQTKKNNTSSQTELTATGKQFLTQIAEQIGTSVDQVLEQMAQGKLVVASDNPDNTITVNVAAQGAATTVTVVEESPWQEQLAEKDKQIAKLQKQLSQQEEIQQNYQGISLQNQQQSIYISELEEARSQQRQEIKQLNHQITELQAQLAREESNRQTAMATKNEQIAAKDEQIQKLQGQVQALQGLASIGERELNRWRSNSIK